LTPPGGQRRKLPGQCKQETKQTNGGKQNSLPVLLLGNNAGTKDVARSRSRCLAETRVAFSLPPSLSLSSLQGPLCRVPGEAIKASGFRFADSQAAGQRAQSVLSRSRWKVENTSKGKQ